jgi:D-alanyl-D-alanine dipeptidase
MIYLGTSKEFLTDGQRKLRFEIVSVEANRAEARVFEGKLNPMMLLTNRRAVLRAKNAPAAASPSTASTTTASSAAKPIAVKHKNAKWCTDRDSCAKFCSGKYANASAVSQMITQQKLSPPAAMVDPAVAIQPELEKLGCTPDKSQDAAKASKGCGILFVKPKSGRGVLPGVVPGLARAAIEAKARGYVIWVGSTFRSHKTQVDLMCENLSEGGPPCGKGTGLACPGPNVHTEGYAVDLHLRSPSGKKLTPPTGKIESCSARTALVKRSKELMDLNDIMFKAGWWKYCEELWHFEYTQNPYNDKRTKSY